MEELIEHNGFVSELPGIRQKPTIGNKLCRQSPVGGHNKNHYGRILVVDDERSIQEVLNSLLSVMGYEVVSAGSGHEGLHLFLENPIELVLTDMNMPGMDGSTLAAHIKKKSPITPVILITGSDKDIVDKKLKKSCIDSVLFKPFGLEDLQKTVQRIVEKKKDSIFSVPLSLQRYSCVQSVRSDWRVWQSAFVQDCFSKAGSFHGM
jgi:CheY-like chemotaxis protein